jgi:serine/tyrosine/threonine adenylyltransferase
MSTSFQLKKHSISKLPLPPTSHVLTHNLTADVRVPSVDAFRKVLRNQKLPDVESVIGPSIQRRSRLLDAPCHFAYVAPFPVGFPYEIRPPEDGEEIEDKGLYVEKWLSDREAVNGRPVQENGEAIQEHSRASLRVHYPNNRDQPIELIGLSETGLRDCIPHLDVGDAFALLGTPTLAHSFDEEEIIEGGEREKQVSLKSR